MAVTLYSYHKVDCHSVCYLNYIILRDLLQWWPMGGDLGPGEGGEYLFKPWFPGPTV